MFLLRSRNSLVLIFSLVSLFFIVGTVLKSKGLFSSRQHETPQISSTTLERRDTETLSDNTVNESRFSKSTIKEILSQMMKENLLNPRLLKPAPDHVMQASEGPPVTEAPKSLIDVRVAQSLSSKVKVLCWLPTRERYWNTRLKAVNETWGRRCDKIIYFITRPINKSHDVIGVNIEDSRRTLTDKTVYAHNFIYRYYLDSYDWFLKADDDTYIIMENLKFLLWHFDPDDPGYIGYMSGGAGYVFNRGGLKQLVEKGYNIPARCRHKGGAEDIETGRCAYKAGIRTLNQLDVYQKQTFLPANVYANALGPMPSWADGYMRAKVETGKNCCSQLLVSFHYTGPKLMYSVEFLLYRVAIHGRRFMTEKAFGLFDGKEAKDMERSERRRAYPGETMDEYYAKGWREKNTTIYINPNL